MSTPLLKTSAHVRAPRRLSELLLSLTVRPLMRRAPTSSRGSTALREATVLSRGFLGGDR